jgi:hypothetical protein
MAGQDAPSDFLFDVIGVGFRVDLDSISGLRLYVTNNVPRRNYKSMITAGTDPRGVIAASNGGP